MIARGYLGVEINSTNCFLGDSARDPPVSRATEARRCSGPKLPSRRLLPSGISPERNCAKQNAERRNKQQNVAFEGPFFSFFTYSIRYYIALFSNPAEVAATAATTGNSGRMDGSMYRVGSRRLSHSHEIADEWLRAQSDGLVYLTILYAD